jgi:hypothetical protein
MAYLGRKGATAALASADIPDNSITAAKIVDATIVAADLAPNSVDSSELVDGSIDTAHIGDDQVTGAKIENNPTIAGNLTVSGDIVPSTPLSHRNIIINGAMNVAQRGASSTSGGYQTVDHFKSGGGTVGTTQSQENLTSSDTGPWEAGFRKAYKAVVTSTTSATGAYYSMDYRAEAQDIANSGWDYTNASSYITLSFWALSNDAGTYHCDIRTRYGTRYWYSQNYTLVANTWKKIELTFPGKSDLTINNDNLYAFEIMLFVAYGTGLTGSQTAGSWQAYPQSADETIASPDGVSWMNSSGSYIMTTGVQLELGSNATPFEHRSYGDELQRCMRYYEKLDYSGTGDGYGVANTQIYQHVGSIREGFSAYYFRTTMNHVPDFTYSHLSHFRFLANGEGFATTAISANSCTYTSRVKFSTTNGGTAGHGAVIDCTSSSGWLAFDAEL